MNLEIFFLTPMTTAINGHSYRDETSHREVSIHRPIPINTSEKSVVWVAERHWHETIASGQAAVLDHVVLKARWPAFDHAMLYTDRCDPIAHEARRRQELGRLPSMGSLSHCIRIPMDRMLGSMARLHDDIGIASGAMMSVLVTPLRRESVGGTTPITLATAMPRHGCHTRREMSNWLELALTLTRALWTIHDKGYAHCDIKPENIVLRSDHGYWRDIALIDFEHVVENQTTRLADSSGTWLYFRPERLSSEDYVSNHACEDVYALGVTLLEVLRGGEWRDRVFHDTDSNRDCPTEHLVEMRRWARERRDSELEIRGRARRLCYRYLLHTPLSMNCESEGATPALLDEFLCALEKLKIRQHRWRLHTVGTGSVNEPVPASTGDVMLMELTSLSLLVSREELQDWCRRYTMEPAEAAFALATESGDTPPDPGLAPSEAVYYGVELLRAGYGRAAQRWFDSLLRDHAAHLNEHETVRVLRLLVGLLLIRTRSHEKALGHLARYEHAGEQAVQWWARLLGQKLAYHSHEPFPYDPDTLAQPPSHRARLWLCITNALPVLQCDDIPGDMASRLCSVMSGAQSAYETSIAALYMARAYSARRDPTAWCRVVATLVMAANHAVTGKLPYEYAASLCEAARLVSRAFDDPALGFALHEQGFDDEEALVTAGRCAALAAEIYHRLDAPHRNVAALELAAQAYLRCPSPERRTEGLRYRSLARSNAALWPVNAPVAETERDQRLPQGIARWRQACAERHQTAVADDPAAVLAHHFYARYSHLLLSLRNGRCGLAVELPGAARADTDGSQRVSTGAATSRLFRAWREHDEPGDAGLSLLDVGCGVGTDAAVLVENEPNIDSALGIDISEWHIQQARARTRTLEQRLAFERIDFNEIGEHYPERFHLALARDSLYHATDRATALRSIRKSLRPGGYLLATDWVQIRPALPTQMRRLASTQWLTSMQPLNTYGALLREVGFECKWHRLEPAAMHECFRAASEQARRKQAEQPEAAALGHFDRIRTMLTALTEISHPETGMISWVFLVAKAI